MRSRNATPIRKYGRLLAGALILCGLSTFAGTTAAPATRRATLDRTGVFPTRDGLTLKFVADQGSVTIVPLDRGASPVVRYSVHVETDLHSHQAQQVIERYSLTAKATPYGVEIVGALPPQPTHGAQFSVHFEIAVPANYNLDVNTEVGDIEAGDIGGTAVLATQGGNIHTQRIGRHGLQNSLRGRPVAKLVTEGGHIEIGDVVGDVSAFTAGGNITTGYISGEANLHTGGGHIRALGISGRGELVSIEGGNITVGKASKYVSAKTGGGQIDFGEVHGSVHAQTGGGGIRVMYVAGPMQLESNEGSICLTKVASAVRAATGDGSITAWINPDKNSSGEVRLAGVSQLSSGSGDIIVYLPRDLAANIEAIVETGGEKRIEADPALALQFSSSGSGLTKGWLPLNGGGAPLRLKTTTGKIKLQYLDSETELRDSLIRQQIERLERGGVAAPNAPQAPPNPPSLPSLESSWSSKVELALMGGVRVDTETFQQHVTYKPLPEYPVIAKKAGVRGRVRLQVRLTQDGRVQIEKVVEGSEPSLVDATIAAVKRWRGVAGVMDGKKVDMISTVKIEFQ
jgi:TonB family protein